MLRPLFEWAGTTSLSQAILQSTWQSAAFNLVHLMSMIIFVGAILLVDLRLLGKGLTSQPIAEVARGAQPWLIGGFLGLLITGVPSAMSTAFRLYETPLFWFKMYVLFVGVIFTLTLRRKIALATDEGRVRPVWAKLVGAASILMWAMVAASARLLMLY
jgi:hypothetical protein